jgi:hypothetical protein
VVETRKLTCDGRFTFKGTDCALFAAQLELGEGLDFTSPMGGTYDGTQHVVLEADGTTVAKSVTIHPLVKYELWLGDTQVTTLNEADILGDGKATFDSATGVLTLNNPVISGKYYGVKSKIYATGIDLTLRGRYAMSGTEEGVSTGLVVRDGTLTIDGDFTFYGTGTGANVNGSCTLMGGLKAVGGAEGVSLRGAGNSLTFVKGFMNAAKLEMEGSSVRALYVEEGYTITDKTLLAVTGGTLNDYNQIRFTGIRDHVRHAEQGRRGLFADHAGQQCAGDAQQPGDIQCHYS